MEKPIETVVLSDVQTLEETSKMGKIRLILTTSTFKYILTFEHSDQRKIWSEAMASFIGGF